MEQLLYNRVQEVLVSLVFRVVWIHGYDERPGKPVRFAPQRFRVEEFNAVTISRSIPAEPINRSPLVGLDSPSTEPKAL
jgi:hypothetical protein